MLLTIPRYIDIIDDSSGFTRTLGVIDVCRDASGRPEYTVGNNSILFKIRHEGRLKMLKCYTRPKRNLRRIYGDRCLREELYVYTNSRGGEWVDVVLCDYIEGRTLRRAIADSLGDAGAMGRLADTFDRFALGLLGQEWAHGDLKPDNIIVDGAGVMHAIDFDAVFLPEFAGEKSDETGTAAFQHPRRTAGVFDKHIDDYPIALISSALHALSADPTLHERYDTDGFLLFDPHDIFKGRSAALQEVLSLFASHCMAAQYRIAEMLASPLHALPDLGRMLGYAVCPPKAVKSDAVPELSCRDSLWGYAADGEFVIPPLYDTGFEFRGDMAVVTLGGCSHILRRNGEKAALCVGGREVRRRAGGSAEKCK